MSVHASSKTLHHLALPVASQARRSRIAPFVLLPSVVLTGIAYSAGSSPALTNVGFLWMAVCCFGFLISELKHLKERQGWGAMTMYAGALIWFCIDYFTHWWSPNWHLFPQGIELVIAKMAFLHTLFVCLMSFGFGLRVPDRFMHWINRYPEPVGAEFLFWFSVVLVVANFAYIYLFSYDPFFTTIWKSFFGGRLGQSGYKVALSGNLNYSFLGYLSFLQGYVYVASVTSIAYITMARSSAPKKIVCGAIFAYSLLWAYGGGTRTAVAGILLSAGVFILLYGIQNNAMKMAWRWILALGIVGMSMVQLQTFFRSDTSTGLYIERINFADKRLTSEVGGNTMFSEALDAYFEIPEKKEFFHNSFSGEGALRAIPQMVFWFAIGPIPRPLWKNKPVDPAWAYRAENAADSSLGSSAHQGTTVSYGLIGAWYFRFGLAGVIEGAIVMGWFYAIAERMMRTVSLTRSFLRMTIAIFFLSTLFFFYRDIVFFGVWQVILLYVVAYLFITHLYQKEWN